MKSFTNKLTTALILTASVTLLAGCSNGSSSSGGGGGVAAGIVTPFGTAVACVAGAVATQNAISQSAAGFSINWQIQRDGTPQQNVVSICGTMQVNYPFYAGQCVVQPGTYSIGMSSGQSVQFDQTNTLRNSVAMIMSGTGGSYAMTLDPGSWIDGLLQPTIVHGQFNFQQGTSGANYGYGQPVVGTTGISCNDYQGVLF